jgi:porin
LALVFVAQLAPGGRAQDITKPADSAPAISGNPGAVNVAPGTGSIGQLLGLSPESGLRLGGVLVSNANQLLVGGSAPGVASFNNLLVADAQADLARLGLVPGATLGSALLRFDGQPSNHQAGTVTGYNGLTGLPPLYRTELYELWWRQSLLDDRLILRTGKLVPTYDFDNVTRPVPVQDVALQIPAVSGLIYTPLFVNPTILGALPGYYNSAHGITTTVAPSTTHYLSLGIYDGNNARGDQTGLRGLPTFNAYRFSIGEIGSAWLLGPGNLPGMLGAGTWDQTGTLTASRRVGTVTQDGTHGVYAFASQRLWRSPLPDDPRGISAFAQAGANDSRTMLATRYIGFGFTLFGMIPGRPDDSAGAGLAWSWFNSHPNLRPQETLLQFYDQLHVRGPIFLQPVLTVSPNPGLTSARQPAVVFTVQSTVLF